MAIYWDFDCLYRCSNYPYDQQRMLPISVIGTINKGHSWVTKIYTTFYFRLIFMWTYKVKAWHTSIYVPSVIYLRGDILHSSYVCDTSIMNLVLKMPAFICSVVNWSNRLKKKCSLIYWAHAGHMIRCNNPHETKLKRTNDWLIKFRSRRCRVRFYNDNAKPFDDNGFLMSEAVLSMKPSP